MRDDLLELFELDELKKYLTEEELPANELPGQVPGLAWRRRGR